MLHRMGRHAEARTWIEKALASGGATSGEVVEHYGDILYALGDHAGAVEQWRKALALGGASEAIGSKVSSGRPAGMNLRPMTRPAARPLRCILGLLLLLGPGCRPVKQVFQADRELPLRSAEKVVENALAALPADVHYFSAKADVDLVMPDASRSFRSAVRLVTDSALWVSITPALGIEVARALVTVDSVKVLDRLKDAYFMGGRDSAWARFGIDPDLDLLQQALLGRPIGLDPRGEVPRRPRGWTLCAHKPGEAPLRAGRGGHPARGHAGRRPRHEGAAPGAHPAQSGRARGRRVPLLGGAR
ncbi:MAG: DUF4292 domain-containing protein [Flavobacteriales bacterium]|nr:DUF4292 domain-containing protein [Flavobacteriales bacterium]